MSWKGPLLWVLLGRSEHVANQLSILSSPHRQVIGLAAATMGWLLSVTSMGLAAWRMWHITHNPRFPAGLACVGMWRVCIYHHVSYFRRVPSCYRYSAHDTFLPPRLCAAQSLLLAAVLLALVGKACAIFALRNAHMGALRRHGPHGPFVLAGLLQVTAGLCMSATVVLNHYSVMKEEGIPFPPSFNLPFKPDTQEVGSVSVVALMGAFLLLLSGFFFLSYRAHHHCRVYPECAEHDPPGCTGSAEP